MTLVKSAPGPTQAPMPVLWPPDSYTRLAEFEILGELGEGSTARVVCARHVATNRLVAIKLYHEVYWGLMLGEAAKLKLLRHPNLARLLGYWEEPGATCLVTELVDGPDLGNGLLDDPVQVVPIPQVVDAAIQVSAGLAYLHACTPPIIHGDVKPKNMVRDKDGLVVLVDLEASIFAGEEGHPDMGSWGYIAPEQEQGHPTPRSDVYALGISLWQMLSGTCPEPEQGIFPPLPESCPSILEAFLRRMLSQEESLRPDAQECLAYFQALQAPQNAKSNQYQRARKPGWLLALLLGKKGNTENRQAATNHVVRVVKAGLRWRAAIRQAAERLTLRLTGWKLVLWILAALAAYAYTWVRTYLWVLSLISRIPPPLLEGVLAGALTIGWMVWPLIRYVRRPQQTFAFWYVVMVQDSRGRLISVFYTFSPPDEATLQKAIADVVESAARVNGVITAPSDYTVSVQSCEISSREFRRALRRQKAPTQW